MEKLSLLTINPLYPPTDKRVKAWKICFLAFILFCIGNTGFAQVLVTPATGGTVICPQTAPGGSAPACTTLGTITIAESGSTADFTIGANNITLSPPTGWQFCIGTPPTLGYTAGADITATPVIPAGGFTATSLVINFNVASTTRFDQITITGLQVQPLTPIAPFGYIFASTTTGVIGITTGAAPAGTDFGKLMLSEATSRTFTVFGGGAYCTGGLGVDVGLNGSDSGMFYELFRGPTLVSTLVGTGDSLDFGFQTVAGTYTVVATNGALCGYTATMTGSAVVTLSASTISPIVGVPGPGIHNLCAYIDSEVVSDATPGGIWNSDLVTVDTAGLPLGRATIQAFAAGIATVTYTVGSTGCRAVAQLTVNPLPDPIVGPDSVCVGSTVTLTDLPEGGAWTSSNTAIATIGTFSGIVTGVSASPPSILITYTLPSGCSTHTNFTVNPLPSSITSTTGSLSVCAGSTILVNSSPAGGAWTSGNTTVATVAGLTGGSAVVGGINATSSTLTAPIIYTLPTGCAQITTVTVDPVPTPITGSSVVCVNGTTTLGDGSFGGTWASTNPLVATVDPTSGTVTGVHAGVDTITYTLNPGNCSVMFSFTVNPLPSPILGPDSVCVGSSIVLSDTSAGGPGTWTTDNPGVASIDPSSGSVITFAPGGVANITYTLPTGCAISEQITVNPLPSAIVSETGADSVCALGTLTFSDGTVGGVWTLSDPSLATIVPHADADSIDVIMGGGAGFETVTYTLGVGGCSATFNFTIDPIPAIPSPSPGSVCQGSSITFTDTTPFGTWSSSITSIATIDSVTGVADGLAPGTVTITYTGRGNCPSTTSLTVHPINQISANDSVLCTGATATLADTTFDISGVWVSSDNTIASIVNDTTDRVAIVTAGNVGGIAIITYTTSFGCSATFQITVNPTSPITGTANTICQNDSLQLNDAIGPGFWTVTDPTIATVNAIGLVYGLSPGIDTVVYTLTTGCAVRYPITVNVTPPAIFATIDSVCMGQVITLSDDSPGGDWLSSDPAIATATPTGTFSTITGVSAGTAIITYELPDGCFVDTTIIVNPIYPVYSIDSAHTVCMLDSIQLLDTTHNGTWVSSNPAIATVDSAGFVTGVTAGVDSIYYNIPGTHCQTEPYIVTVNPIPSPITGIDSVCVHNHTTLFDTSTTGGVSGTWTSGNTTIATVVDTSGFVTGVSAGTDVITYTLPNTGCLITVTVTVDSLPSGIIGDTSLCNGDSTLLRDTTRGGYWTSSDPSVATVNDTGYVKALSPGTTIISYTLHVGACPASITVIVHDIPVISIASAPNPPVICKGARDTLSASSPDDPLRSYVWSPSVGLSTTVTPTTFASPTLTTTYEVIGTTTFGCRDSAFITVVVDSALNHLKITGLDSVCAGQCAVLIASGNPEAAFAWHPATGLSNTIGDTVTACPSVTTTYEAVAIDAMGCSDSATFTLTINPIPNIVVTPNPAIVCRGVPKQLIATTTNTDNNTTIYAWTPNILISCDTCSNPYVSDTFNLVYQVTAITKFGCYDSLDVKVSVLDTNVNTISTYTNICIGDSTQLLATSHSVTSNLDIPTYLWTPATGLNFDNINNPIATPTVTTTYSVTITENACFTAVDTVTVIVQPLPFFTITPHAPINVVAGTPTNLTVIDTNVIVRSYLWVPGNSLNCDTCANPVATPTVNTTYTVTVTSIFGCVTVDTVTVDITCDNSQVFVPNTFTPNGDGVNDRFFVSAKGIKIITNFLVFNRWGQMVFEAHNINPNDAGAGWDGAFKGYVLEPDVFIYVVDAICEQGTPFHYQGDVSIVK